MEIILIGAGMAVCALLGFFLHRRFGREEPQTHSNVKPLKTHDPKPLVAQGLDGQGMGQ